MKKALLVTGLALCASFAFAQTNNRLGSAKEQLESALQKVKAPLVDYKASIFTKTEDSIRTFTFSANDRAQMSYGANAVLRATDSINGNLVGTGSAHTQNTNAAVWMHIADTAAAMSSSAFSTTYELPVGYVNLIKTYFGPATVGTDDGFMMVSMYNADVSSGNFNAYIEFPGVSLNDNSAVIDVRLHQIYAKFNHDQCFIDYKRNGKWKSREINVKGIDVDVNSLATIKVSYTMPLEIAQEPTLKLRLRLFCNDDGGIGYGYFWGVDNVAIVKGDANRWKNYDSYYVDGGYGMIPHGMKIPLSWFSTVSNNGTVNRTNVKVNMLHVSAIDTVPSTIISVAQSNINAGDPTAQSFIKINERGFLDSLETNKWYLRYFWGYSSHYAANNGPTNYVGIPVTDLGLNVIQPNVSSTGADTLFWNAIRYTVTDETGGAGTDLAVSGYRWAHDNGVIPSRSHFVPGFTRSADGTSVYINEEINNYRKTNYRMGLRYTTGSEIPVDQLGRPWVIKGIEIIPSTDSTDQTMMAGSEIFPFAWKLSFDTNGDDSYSVSEIETGYSTINPYTVNGSSDANYLESGYIAPGQDYGAVNMFFTNQPELQPNQSYYLGYRMNSEGYFSAAQTSYTYWDGTKNVAYRNTEAISRYHAQFNPCGYDIYIYDPVANYGSITTADSWSSFPMIRAIVGPREALPQVTVIPVCTPQGEDTMRYQILNSNREDLCASDGVSYNQGSGASFYFVPADTAHYVIDSIVINGTAYSPWNEDSWPSNIWIDNNAYNVMNPADTTQVALYRSYFVVSIDNMQANYTIQAKAHWEPWHIGIDPVAANVALGVQPNPATSQVKVNVAGVTGMVNCSIIDMSGRVVYNRDINAEVSHTINLNNFARGAYFVRITNDTFSKVEKLIVR